MRKIFVTGLVMLCFGSFLLAGDGQYSAKTIPANLLKDAHVVKRFEELRFELYDLDKAIVHRKFVLTILDENGDRFARVYEDYDKKFFGVPDITGRLYDANGVTKVP